MNFHPHLAELVLRGHKTVTRRPVEPDKPRSPYHPDRAPRLVGKSIAVCPGRGKPADGRVTVVAVIREHFDPGHIAPIEAEREGFITPTGFMLTWLKLHGNADPVDVWRIELQR